MNGYGTIIVGGGASGLFCAAALKGGKDVLVLERGERAGRKLSATGNGQGNVSNLHMSADHYFHQSGDSRGVLSRALALHGREDMLAFLEGLGGLFVADGRGRVYPTGKQASSVTDLLRFRLAEKGVRIAAGMRVRSLRREADGFVAEAEGTAGTECFFARRVVLCTGGSAAKNFGTDGSAYALATAFGHTLTPLYPSLVQLKTEREAIRGLKGIRAEARLSAFAGRGREKRKLAEERGDLIFTDYGVSGDAVFRLSAFLTDRLGKEEISLSAEFLPDISPERLLRALRRKRAAFPSLADGELAGGIVNNALGRAIARRSDGTPEGQAARIKDFPLAVTGSLGFDGAQVTKGGIPLDEADENLQSRLAPGLYFAGEILDVDGECGGYNLQWAYSSARLVADGIDGISGRQER